MNTNLISTLQAIYPVGAIYIGTTAECPIASLFGTWERIEDGLVLQNSDNEHEIGTTIAAGLPDIKGTAAICSWINSYGNFGSGAFARSSYSSSFTQGGYGGAPAVYNNSQIQLNASDSSSIYGNSNTVQPPAYVVNIWRRTA